MRAAGSGRELETRACTSHARARPRRTRSRGALYDIAISIDRDHAIACMQIMIMTKLIDCSER
jgi:hypothetical protein